MKYLTLLFCAVSLSAHSQTGRLVCDVQFYSEDNREDYNNSDDFSVTLSQNGVVKHQFDNVFYSDTLDGIVPGKYTAQFSCCEEKLLYQETIHIEENSTTYFYFEGDAWEDIEHNDNLTANFEPVYAGYKFGIGIPEADRPHNAFVGSIFVGFNQPFGKSPVTWGMEYSFEYSQANYGNVDLNDPLILHQKQHVSNFNFSVALHTGILIRKHKFFNVGVRYHLPMVARYVQVSDESKTKFKGIHNFTDVRLFARIGFIQGFVFAEYRPITFLKTVYPDIPKLNVGVCFQVPYY